MCRSLVNHESLSGEHREQLVLVLARTGLSRKQVATQTGLSLGQLSLLLSGGCNSTRVQVCALLDVVCRLFANRVLKGEINQAEFEETNILLNQLKRWYNSSIEHAMPGQTVPLGAPYYIERPVDGQSQNLLVRPPFTVLVEGPPHSGKSSLLARLSLHAESQKYRVARMDCRLAALYHEEKLRYAGRLSPEQSDEVVAITMARFAYILARTVQELWGIESDAQVLPTNGPELTQWLRRAFHGKELERHLLVLDDVSALPWPAVVYLFRLLSVWGQERALGFLLFSIALGLRWANPELWDAREELRYSGAVQENVQIGWLNREEVQRLLKLVAGQAGDEHLNVVVEAFGGQPLLTHAAATLLAQGEPWQKVYGLALDGVGVFGGHLRALKKAPACRLHQSPYYRAVMQESLNSDTE